MAAPLFAPNAHIWPDDLLIRLEICAVVTPDPALTWMISSSSPIRYLMDCGDIQLDLSWNNNKSKHIFCPEIVICSLCLLHIFKCTPEKTFTPGLFQQFGEKAPGQNWEKMIYLTSKLREINDIEQNKGSKIYPQNQVILDCIMPSIPLKHKCLSIILIWVLFLMSSSGL